MRVLLTRPQEDNERLAVHLAARGIETVAAPLIEIRPAERARLDTAGVQAFLVTSANGARALAAATECRDRPVLAVGEASAAAARAAGFAEVSAAGGDVDALAALAAERLDPAAGALLHAAGRYVAGDLAGRLQSAGFGVRREVLYYAETAATLPDAARQALAGRELDGALFFSPRTGGAFVRLARMADLDQDCAHLSAYCLSGAVAEAVRALPWRALRIAAAARQEALLALLEDWE